MKNSFISKVKILILTIVILFFLGELALRINDTIKGYYFFSNEHRDQLVIKSSVVPFRTFGPKYYTEKGSETYISSSHGELFPLVKLGNTFRIVCFGGSTTRNEWTFLRYKEHYPMLLQKFLQHSIPDKNIEVINVAYDAYATPHLLILLELDVISWSPDLVIISENWNDMDATYYEDLAFDYSNKYGRSFFTTPGYIEKFTTLNALFRWSSFYWFIKYKYDNIVERFFPPKKEIAEDNFLIKASDKTISYENEPPKISQDIFRRNLLNFYFIANKWGIPVLFATQALKSTMDYVDFVPHDVLVKNYQSPSFEQRRFHHKFFNIIIKEVALNTNSYFLDNDSLMNGEAKYFIDVIHYTQAGITKLANNYSDYILSKNIINTKGLKNVKTGNNF